MIPVNFKLEETDKPHLERLQKLSPEQLDVLIAVQTEPMTAYAIVAIDLSIPLNTVKTRLHRARRRIITWRKALENEQAHS